MPIIYDLHSHSTASDGTLSPSDLVLRASKQGVGVLALTDHDTLAGQKEALHTAQQADLQMLSGVEISTIWEGKCLHIVGLNFALAHDELNAGLAKIQTTRVARAKAIDAKLTELSITGAYEAVARAASGKILTCTHFADYLVANGHVANKQEAFSRYLGVGKPASVPTEWAKLADAIGWICRAGGVAVLAHPLRYKLATGQKRRLLDFFKHCGGSAIEVVTGGSSAEEIRLAAFYAARHNLAGSQGSDFHTPSQHIELGRLDAMPPDITPVWQLFQAAAA